MDKQGFLKIIRKNINDSSFHVTVVKGKGHPRFAYTIGAYEKYKCEFIIAGNVNFKYEDILLIFREVFDEAKKILEGEETTIQTANYGSFSLSKIHSSWSNKTMLGVYDFYNISNFTTYQLLPDKSHFTLDIPDMSSEWNPRSQPIWKWLDNDIEWDLNVPFDSMVTTDVNSLFGKKITEVMRWEINEWEAFNRNGEDVEKEDIRIVPINVMLGIDDTLLPILTLEVEKGFWRDEENMEWQNWGN